MITPTEIAARIIGALPGAEVQTSDLTGGGDHFRVRVTALQFEGIGLVDRHRMVYAAVRDILGGALHALSLETVTPAERDRAATRSGGAPDRHAAGETKGAGTGDPRT